jgi:hypothetical protein
MPEQETSNIPEPTDITPAIDFSKPPEEMQTYKAPDKFTRENFTNGVNYSFIISRGSFSAQQSFLDWIDIHKGAHSAALLDNYTKAGGHNALTEEEKRVLVDNYKRTTRHANRLNSLKKVRNYDEEDINNWILGMIDRTLKGLAEKKDPAMIQKEELVTMSWDELRHTINHMLNAEKDVNPTLP